MLQDAVPLLMIAGDIEYSFSISKGWKPVGHRTTITEADGRVVYRIGDMKALDFYRDYLGDHSKPAAEFPLAVHDAAADGFYTRVPVQYDEEEASITFGAPIPEGAVVQLSETTPTRIIEQVQKSVAEVSAKHGSDPAAALAALRRPRPSSRPWPAWPTLCWSAGKTSPSPSARPGPGSRNRWTWKENR